MASEAEEIQFVQAVNALQEFVKILVKEYPLVFKDGSGVIRINDSIHQEFNPYDVILEIKKK